MVSIRLADAADYGTYAKLYPELDAGEPVATLEHFTARMLPRVVIAESANDAGVVASVGYAFWQCYGATAHVVHLVVDASARRRGAGSALLRDVRERAEKEGCSRLFLNVRRDNEAALKLYARLGLTIEQEGFALGVLWPDLRKISESKEETTVFLAGPADDAEIAERFSIIRERIALLRARGRAVLLGLRDREGAICAFGAFDPGVPIVYPVAVARLAIAGAFFRALHAHAEHVHVRMFVEGNRALADLLIAHGADVELELYRMSQTLAPI